MLLSLGQLRNGLRFGMKTKPIEVVFALGVMEIETWFLAEHTHFARVSPELTTELIKEKLGFDPSVENPEGRCHPSRDLHDIYCLVGFAYDKSKSNVQRTVDRLSYESLYLKATGHTIFDLETLIDSIDGFLSA